MALNYPGPWQVDIFYGASAADKHVQKLNLIVQTNPTVGTPMASINASSRGGTLDSVQDWIDAYVLKMKALLATSDTVFYADLYKVADGSFDRTWYSTLDIGVAGTNAGTRVPASQLIYTFRTQEGGIMKLSYMETVYGPSISQSTPTDTALTDIIDLIVATTNPWLARDTSFPISFIAVHPGQNEKRFKDLYR